MKLVKTKLNGLDLWYREDDRCVGQRIAEGKYEEYETMLMLSQVDKNSVVVDVGANIGYYTLLLARRCKRVYAIEPDKECFEILKKNVTVNNLKNVILINEAASDENERRLIIKDRENYGNSRLGVNKSGGINCRRLDDILYIEQKIYLVKIDVQGWERAVIEGAKKIMKKDRPVLFLEYNGSDKMISFLKKIYKNIWSIDYWFYVCRRGIRVDPETGYVDLWLKDKMNWRDWWWTIKKVRIKKVIKAIMGYGKNK